MLSPHAVLGVELEESLRDLGRVRRVRSRVEDDLVGRDGVARQIKGLIEASQRPVESRSNERLFNVGDGGTQSVQQPLSDLDAGGRLLEELKSLGIAGLGF